MSFYRKKYARLVLWLKTSRLERELTMRELAEKLGAPHSFVQKIEFMERRLDFHEHLIPRKI